MSSTTANLGAGQVCVFVTENTEYHTRDHVCVAVRDRHSHQWIRGHMAIGSPVSGSFASGPGDDFAIHIGSVSLGERICFENGVLTSHVCSVRSPGPNTLSCYPLFAA